MLKIYTSVEKAKELSKLPVCFNIEARFIPLFESDNTLFNDNTSTKILQRIDGMTMRYDNETIKAKFWAVRMQDLSTGCKGLLLATKLNSKIIFIDDYDSIEPADETKLISIIRESKNLFVLMAHKDVPKCGYNHRSILGFEHDGKKYNAIQLFEVPSDYIMNQSVYI